MPLDGNHLVKNIDIPDGAAGVFGLCYSVLTWSGVLKGLGLFSPWSWVKTTGKMFEDGHATTFLIDLGKKTLTLTGISDEGWEFEEDRLADVDWARTTSSSTTYVYYIAVDGEFIKRYRKLQGKLKGTRTAYAALWPNLWGANTTYQNCVSHSHYLMKELGLAFFTNQVSGWWIPSASNWTEWFKSFVPTYHGNYWWKYKRFLNTNTHIP